MKKSLKMELAEARLLALRYHDITAAIANMLDGKEWTPETLNDIADILRSAGFIIGEPCQHVDFTEAMDGTATCKACGLQVSGLWTKGEK